MWDSAVLLVLLSVLLLGCKSSGKSEQVVMGDVPSGGSPSARWQPTAADFIIPKTLRPRRASTANAPCSMSRNRGLRLAPHRQPRAPEARSLYPPQLSAAHVTIADDAFTATTAAGRFPMRNIIAKFPGKKDGIIVIAGHYDTNLPLPKSYVGANDGGSSTGLLLELADVLKGKPMEGYSVWLAWLDGEEATVSWTDSDSLYGSKHLAAALAAGRHAEEDQSLFAARHGGRRRPEHRPRHQLDRLAGGACLDAATRLGYQSHFFARQIAVEDDHLPFAKLGVPVADLIDFDYGYNNVFWHTPAGHPRQAEPRQPANRRRHGARNHPRAGCTLSV